MRFSVDFRHLFLFFILTGLAVPEASAQDPFGDLARTHALTAADDYRIGKEALQMSTWMWGVLDDKEKVNRVERIARQVLAHSDRPDMIINISIIASPEINAAALPGGFLLVFDGALKAFDDDQLAFVIAHEISHVLLRHFATTRNLEMASAALNVAEKAQAENNRDAVEQSWDQIMRMMARHSRSLEFEADLYGLVYSVRAGFPAKASISSMELMNRELGAYLIGVDEEYLDHPTFPDRITQLESGLETVQNTIGKFDAGLSWMNSGQPEQAVASFQEFLSLFPRSASAWSNLAAAWLQQGFRNEHDGWYDVAPMRTQLDVSVRGGETDPVLERARDACSKALAIDPNLPEALGVMGVLARRAGDLESAATILDKALALAPEHADLRVNRAVLDAQSGKIGPAMRSLEAVLVTHPVHPYAIANLALLSEQKGKKKDAIELWSRLAEHKAFSTPAKEHLVALGTTPKPQSKDPARVPNATVRQGTGGGDLGPIALGQSLATAVEVLGQPDYQDSDPDGLFSVMLWYEKGIDLTASFDAIISISASTPSDWSTKEGVAVGNACAIATSTYGSADDEYSDPMFQFSIKSWYDRGLTVQCQGDEILMINVFSD